MTARLTLDEAARWARTSSANVRAALDSGDLRNLTPRAVELWTRARNASAFYLAQNEGPTPPREGGAA